MANKLIDKLIVSVKIAEDKLALRFEASDGEEIVAKVDGDCCSNTWIESVELPALGFPFRVLAVEDLEMPDLGTPDDYDCISYYGCKIKTDKGDMVIDYRNSSNGYYGGDIWFPDDDESVYNDYYGGVYGQNESDCVWRELE